MTNQACSTCAECGEDMKLDQIRNIIDLYKDREGSLIQVLHLSQELLGYLPMPVMQEIADGLGLPLSEVTGVVTFYSFFSTQPKGKHTIRICMGTACYVRGGKRILDHLMETLGVELGGTTEDRLFTVEVARCIGACGLAPAMMIDNTVFKQVTPNKLDSILVKYRGQEGKA